MITCNIFKTNNLNRFSNIKTISLSLNNNFYFPLICQSRQQTTSTEVSLNKNALRVDSVAIDTSSSELIKAFQLLRTKPRGYDDLNLMLELSNKALGCLPLLKSHELADICEILSAHKYRNVLLMHGISESLYWLCKLKKVRLKELSRFLKSCYILRYVPNVRYLDEFVKEIDDVRHVKSVGDYLRFLQFLVHSDLWISDRYLKLYLKLYEHCKNHMGLMSHTQLASFAQTHLIIDNSDYDVFEMICLNFERELSASDVSHLRMLNNSLLCSNIRDLPTPYARVLKYYLNNLRGSITPEFTVEALALLSKFYYRDTECLNKIGLAISDNISNYSFSQLSLCLNHFASLSYKHKSLIIGVSRSITDSSNEDLFSKFSLIAALSNLISKVKYNHIGSINAVSTSSTNAVTDLKNLMESCNIINSGGGHSKTSITSTDYNRDGDKSGINHKENAIEVSSLIFKQSNQKCLPTSCKSILTTDSFVQATAEPENGVKKRRSILRRLKKSFPLVRENVVKESKLKYVPESTDIISVQSLQVWFSNFYLKYFNGEHPALRRLNNRTQMKRQLEKYKKGPGFKVSKSLSNVYYEVEHDPKVNSSIRRFKYKMKYSGSRMVQPSTFYINQVKMLKRCFLSPFVKLVADGTTINVNRMLNSGFNKFMPIGSVVGKNSLIYVDNKLVLRPYHQRYKFKYKTMKEFWRIVSSSNKVDGIIKYFTDNNLWNYTTTADKMCPSKKCILDYISGVMSSLSRLNYVSYHLCKLVLEVLIPKLVSSVLNEYNSGCSNVDLSSFLNSISKIIDSMKIMFLRDKSGIVLSRLEELICSEEFEALTNHYLTGECIEYSLCHKLLENMCRFSFFKYVKDTSFNNLNSEDSLSSIANSEQFKNFRTVLYIIYKLIDAIYRSKCEDKVNLEDKSLVDLINNVIYASWISGFVRGLDNSCNELKEALSNDISYKISEVSKKYIFKLKESLNGNKCDTHLIQKYLDVLNRYKELMRYNNGKFRVEKEKHLNRYLECDEESETEFEDSYLEIMGRYKLNNNMISTENHLLYEIKNKLIPKLGILGVDSKVQFNKNLNLYPPLLYYYHYYYYCNF